MAADFFAAVFFAGAFFAGAFVAGAFVAAAGDFDGLGLGTTTTFCALSSAHASWGVGTHGIMTSVADQALGTVAPFRPFTVTSASV